MKTSRNIISVMIIGLIILYSLSISVYATEIHDLNGIDVNENLTTEEVNEISTINTEKTQEINSNEEKPLIPLEPTSPEVQKKNEDTAKAIGEMFREVGPDAEAVREANEFIQPFAVILNKLMAIILGITSMLMMFVTVLDLLYMAFPPVRDMLDGGATGGQQIMQGSRGSRGSGMYGMQGGMGVDGGMNMGMGSMPTANQNRQAGGGLSAIGRWVSDEAIAACVESKGGPMGSLQNGGQVGPIKSMIFTYMKKRSMFLILFGICVILFTSTAFTDLGVKIGTYILKLIVGIGS